jgi:hypothetical protein
VTPESIIIDMSSGQFLESYDPEYTEDPADPRTGLAVWTNEVGRAQVFPSAKEALECWRTQSVTKPLRPDGQPNRPLSAYTVSISPLADYVKAAP